MLFWGDEKPKRKPMSKTEWEVKKKMMGNKCVICGERVPMCSNCYKKYDAGKLTATQLKKIGLTPETYKKIIPAKKKSDSFW